MKRTRGFKDNDFIELNETNSNCTKLRLNAFLVKFKIAGTFIEKKSIIHKSPYIGETKMMTRYQQT